MNLNKSSTWIAFFSIFKLYDYWKKFLESYILLCLLNIVTNFKSNIFQALGLIQTCYFEYMHIFICTLGKVKLFIYSVLFSLQENL